MTKEIIIDNVDVSGCEFAVKPINDNRIKCHCVKGLLQIARMGEQPESIKSGLCEDNPNCYYKQLKRLEQENEELKTYIESNKQQVEEVETLVMDNDRLLNENKKLKERQINWYNHEATNYKQALEEIREYLQQFKKKKSNFYTLNDVITNIANNIEKIISEALR